MTKKSDWITSSLQHQDSLELEALELLEHPAVRSAREQGQSALLDTVKHLASTTSMEIFEESCIEIALNAILNVVNGSSGGPKPRVIMRLPHAIDAVRMPGTRGLDDNPDTFTRIIPMEGMQTFSLVGQCRSVAPTIFEISVLSNSWETIGHLSKNEITHDADGRWRVEVGDNAVTTRSNRLPTREDAEMLIVRETLADWSEQLPCHLLVESTIRAQKLASNLYSDSSRVAAAAAERVRRWFAQTINLHNGPLSLGANHFPAPTISGALGRLVTQAYAIGYFQLAEGQALIIHITPGNAPYFIVPITNLWGVSYEPANRQSSLNSSQAWRSSDGSFSFIVSTSDPGLYNWVDCGRLGQGFLFLRWAGLGSEKSAKASAGIAVSSQLIELDNLEKHVPGDMPRVTTETRKELLQRRSREYAHRYGEASSDI